VTDTLRNPADDDDVLGRIRADLMGRQPDDRPALAVMRAFEVLEAAMRAESAPDGGDPRRLGTDLIREVAHMLQAPLSSIMMLAEVLREGGSTMPIERRDRQLAIIHMAALGLSTLAGDLLTLVDERSEVGPTGPVRLKEMLDGVANIVRPIGEVHECELVVDAPEGHGHLGPALGLERALLGLALRAAMRVRQGTVSLQAWVDEPDYVTFSVTAKGIDMSAQPPDRLFEIFRPDLGASGYTLSADGLGLTATGQLITSLGSSLEVDEISGGGLRFSFRALLPHDASDGRPIPSVPQSGPVGESRRQAPRRVADRRVRS
jgi:signal transduction histidine kinase